MINGAIPDTNDNNIININLVPCYLGGESYTCLHGFRIVDSGG